MATMFEDFCISLDPSTSTSNSRDATLLEKLKELSNNTLKKICDLETLPSTNNSILKEYCKNIEDCLTFLNDHIEHLSKSITPGKIVLVGYKPDRNIPSPELYIDLTNVNTEESKPPVSSETGITPSSFETNSSENDTVASAFQQLSQSCVTSENKPPDSPSKQSIPTLGEEESPVSSEIDLSDNGTDLTASKQFLPPSDSSSNSQQTSTSEEILPSSPDSPSKQSIPTLGEEESPVSSEIDSSDNDTELIATIEISSPSDSSQSQQTSTSEEILPSHTDSPSNLLITPLGEEELPVSSEIDSSDNDTELTVSKQFSPLSDSSSHSQQTSTSEEILPSHTDSSSKYSRHYYCTSVLDEPRTSRESPYMSDNSTSGRSTSPVPMIPITRMRSIGKYHESLKSNFETTLKSLRHPNFSNDCIEVQKFLTHLFLHLLRDVEDFIGFFDGKEPSDIFEASQTPKLSRLESVRSDFASEFRIEEINEFLSHYTGEFFDRIQEITGQEFKLPGDHFKPTDSDSVSDDFGSILLTWNRNTFRDELERNLECIIDLNEELISLLGFYRDSIRAILEFCYRRKLSIEDPRVKEVVNNIISLANNLRNYRVTYKSDLEKYNEILVLKVKIAYELKQILKACLAENLKFWN